MLWGIDKSLRNDNKMTTRKLKTHFCEQFVAAHEVMHFGEHLLTPVTENHGELHRQL